MSAEKLIEDLSTILNEVSGYTLKPATKKQIDLFLDKKFDEAKKVKTKNDVEKVSGNAWLFSGLYTNFMSWEGDTLWVNTEAYGNVSQTFLNYIKKSAKNKGIKFRLSHLDD